MDELALSDEEEKPKPKSVRKARAPAKPRVSKAAKIKHQPEVQSEDLDAGDDFAMDSDEEERQLKAAIRASAAKGMNEKFGSGTTTEVNSRASSIGVGGSGKKVSTPSTGRVSRVAAIRSAESEQNSPVFSIWAAANMSRSKEID